MAESEPKHSPGPWRSGRQDMVSYTLMEGEDGGPWKNIYWDHPDPAKHPKLGTPLPMAVARAYGRTEKEALANARLIALAPELLRQRDELLEALRESRNYIGVTSPDPRKRALWESRTEALIARIDAEREQERGT